MYGHVNCIDSLGYPFLSMVYMVFPSKVFINMNPETFSRVYSFEMFIINMQQGNQRWQTSPAAPPGGLGHGNVHVKFHDDRLRNGGDITY